MPLDEEINVFLLYLVDEARFSPRTVTSYREELLLLRRWCERESLPNTGNLTRDQVVAYLSPEGGSPGTSPATHNRKLTVLRSFFRFLVEKGYSKDNPARDVRFSRLPPKEQPVITRSDLAHVLEAVHADSSWQEARDRCLISMLFHTGLRLDELLSLDVEQIDLENGLLRDVHRKGGGEQPLPLNEAALAALKSWLQERATSAPKVPALFVARGRLKRLSKRAVQARVKEIGTAAGFPFLHPHLLRHSFATELLATGANLEEVRRLMGHRNIATTSRYSHPDQEALRRAVSRLSTRKPTK